MCTVCTTKAIFVWLVNFCSKDDNDLVYCPRDECPPLCKENWPTRHLNADVHMPSDCVSKCTCSSNLKSKGSWHLAQKRNRWNTGKPTWVAPKRQRHRCRIQRKVSERLFAPTIASLGKFKQQTDNCKCKPKSKACHPSNTVCITFHTYSLFKSGILLFAYS